MSKKYLVRLNCQIKSFALMESDLVLSVGFLKMYDDKYSEVC